MSFVTHYNSSMLGGAAIVAAALFVCGPAVAESQLDYLIPPEGYTKVDVAPSDLVTDPETETTMKLPYFNAYPLPDGPVGDPAKTYTICFSQALIRHPWPVAQRGAMKIEEARHPNVKVLYYNTDNDPLRQIQDLETCAAQKPDAIVVWPHSIKPLTPAIEKLKSEGFIVVGVERTIASTSYDSWIYLDDLAESRALAESTCKLLGNKGKVAEQSGAVGSSPAIIRHYGYEKALKELCPDVALIASPPTDFSQAQGYSQALQFLQSPDADGIGAFYVHSGTTALGVAQAMKQTGKQVPIFTIDGSKAEVQAVKNGLLYAVAPHSPVHGDIALRVALYHVLGMDAPKDIVLSVPPLITAENAEEQLKDAWGPLGDK